MLPKKYNLETLPTKSWGRTQTKWRKRSSSLRAIISLAKENFFDRKCGCLQYSLVVFIHYESNKKIAPASLDSFQPTNSVSTCAPEESIFWIILWYRPASCLPPLMLPQKYTFFISAIVVGWESNYYERK